MWWALDVGYRTDGATVAGVGFVDFSAEHGQERVVDVPGPPADYQPGAFYERELPLLLVFLKDVPVTGVIVDGYVWLAADRAGLGAHLHRALGGPPVIGVAKTGFHGSESTAIPVQRGSASKPLYVTSAGLETAKAAELVRSMHGPYRLPTLLKRVDRLSRGDQSRVSDTE